MMTWIQILNDGQDMPRSQNQSVMSQFQILQHSFLSKHAAVVRSWLMVAVQSVKN
jgi:hypothetical protein